MKPHENFLRTPLAVYDSALRWQCWNTGKGSSFQMQLKSAPVQKPLQLFIFSSLLSATSD